MSFHDKLREVTYFFTVDEFADLTVAAILKDTNIKIDPPAINIDEETGFVCIVIDVDKLSDDEFDAITDARYPVDEWYEMTNLILIKTFGTVDVHAYINLTDEGALDTVNLVIPVTVRVDGNEDRILDDLLQLKEDKYDERL